MATFNENFNNYAERRKKKNVVDFFLGDQKEAIEQEILTERYTPNADKNKDISNFLTREDPAEEQARINRLKEISENAKREMESIGNQGQTQAPISKILFFNMCTIHSKHIIA